MIPDDTTVADLLRDLHITHGNPTPEELAIVAAIVSASGQASHAAHHAHAPVPALARSAWADPARRLRGRRAGAPSGWRASGLR